MDDLELEYQIDRASEPKYVEIGSMSCQAINRKTDAGSGGGPFNHTLRVYLIDRERRIRNIYSTGTLDPRLVLADIRTLLSEKSER